MRKKNLPSEHPMEFLFIGILVMLLVGDLLALNGHFDFLGFWKPGEYPEKFHGLTLLFSFFVFLSFLLLALLRLRQSRSRFDRFMDHLHSGVLILKPARIDGKSDFICRSANDHMADILGLKKSELIQKTISDVAPEFIEIGLLKHLEKVAADGHPKKIHRANMSLGQRNRWLTFEIFKSPDQHIILLCDDISEEETRQEIMDRTEEIARIGSWFYDLETNQITWSKQTHKIFGCDPPPYPGTETLFVEAERDYFRKLVDRAIHEGVPYEGIFHAPQQDGSEKVIYVKGFPTQNSQGKVVNLFGSAQDITEQHAVDRELARSRKLLEQTSEVSDTGGWEVDLKTETIYWTPATFSIHARPKEKGEPSLEQGLDYYPEPDRTKLREALDSCRESGEPFDNEFNFIDEDNQWRVVRVLGQAEQIDGQCVRLYGAFQDITKLKQMEEERLDLLQRAELGHRLETLSQFSSGFAHEFNNILQNIVLHSEEALALCEQPPLQDEINSIKKCCRDASELCEQIIIYAGKREMQSQALSPAEAISNWLDSFREEVPSDFKIKTDLRNPDKRAWVDPLQLRQVLLALIQNAVEASPEGPGELTLTTRHVALTAPQAHKLLAPPSDEYSEFICIEVIDHGEGIREEIRSKILEPFFTTKFHGRGLGLSTVMGILRSSHAGLDIVSSPKTGTIFSIYLPARNMEDPSQAPIASSSSPDPDRNAILIVDDEAGIRNGLASALKNRNHPVFTAENGKVGVDLFRQHQNEVGCILLDLTMPVMDGGKALREIRSMSPSVPVIIISGYDAADASFNISRDEVTDFLHKPFSLKLLFNSIEKAMGA